MDLYDLREKAREIEGRPSYRDADATTKTFGEMHAALGISEADRCEFWERFAGHHHSVSMCLAWIEAGKPSVPGCRRWSAAELTGPREDHNSEAAYQAAVARERNTAQ